MAGFGTDQCVAEAAVVRRDTLPRGGNLVDKDQGSC